MSSLSLSLLLLIINLPLFTFRVLAKQNEDWKAQLASEADNNKKLWALLEDVKSMKSQVIAETETSLFATTIEEQKKQIQDLKKENKVSTHSHA